MEVLRGLHWCLYSQCSVKLPRDGAYECYKTPHPLISMRWASDNKLVFSLFFKLGASKGLKGQVSVQKGFLLCTKGTVMLDDLDEVLSILKFLVLNISSFGWKLIKGTCYLPCSAPCWGYRNHT
jgi:hypothetical protein